MKTAEHGSTYRPFTEDGDDEFHKGSLWSGRVSEVPEVRIMELLVIYNVRTAK